jgi:hypothetical protein
MAEMTVADYMGILREIDILDISVSDWESGFIESLIKRNPSYLSDKQIAVIERMRDKYLVKQEEEAQLQMFDDPDGDDIPY